MTRYDVAVLGGGIIGASLAEELTRRGGRVCLIERNTIGCEASNAAAGILSAQSDLEQPDAFFEFCQASMQLYPTWVAHLERVARRPIGYHVDGILHLALTPSGVRQMEVRRRWQRRLGYRVERWSAQEVRRREPNVGNQVKAGFFFPDEAQLDNVALMEALAVACRRAGVAVWEQTMVRRLLVRRGMAAGVQTSRGACQADVVVNCLGSWASLGGSRIRLPRIVPAKGQMLAFEAPKRFLRHVVMSEAGYAVQRRDGTLIAGSTVEFVGFDKRVTMEGLHTIVSGFTRMFRREALEACAFRESWVGLRPCGPDRLPVLGPTRLPGLHAAIGHFRHGILLAPMTAKVMAELILDGRSSFDLGPFSIKRFSK
ncbi:MAG: glycine oxidase ThiO [Candidatus Omnitrophica bacterium]|nr:glycine oxidase ThiO [Candidatus Omnitrophota bacterium]